jgi:hypothetical protein
LLRYNNTLQKRKKFKLSKLSKELKFSIQSNLNNNLKKYLLFMPANWAFFLLKSANNTYVLKLYCRYYFFNIPLLGLQSLITFNTSTNVIFFIYYGENLAFTMWIKKIIELLTAFNRYFFIKIRFSGKGYYIYKNQRNTVTPQFNYSHRIYLYNFNTKVYFLSKTKLILYGLTKKDVIYNSMKVKQKRSVNIFTSRGVRFAKQILYKKLGKVSTYR